MIPATRFRLVLVGIVIIAGFLLLLHRLWTLQIERQDIFILKLPETDKARQRVPGTRGRILDSGGTELARNETCLEIGLNLAAAEAAWNEREKAKPKAQRRSIPKYSYDSKKESATDIIAILNEIVFPELNRIGLYEKPTPEQVRKIYEWYLTYKGVVPYPYVRNLLQADQAKFELIAAYAENATAIPGITIQERPKRRYPLRALGGHFIGYLRETRTEKPPESEGSWDFFESDDVGQAGIEKTENDVVVPAVQEVEVKAVKEVAVVPPQEVVIKAEPAKKVEKEKKKSNEKPVTQPAAEKKEKNNNNANSAIPKKAAEKVEAKPTVEKITVTEAPAAVVNDSDGNFTFSPL